MTPGSRRWTSRASTSRSSPSRRPGRSRSTPPTRSALSREANDVAAEAVRRHPTRLRAFATLPLADPAAAVAELERAAALGFVGTMVYGRVGDVPLDDPRFDEVLARGRRRWGSRSSSTRRSRRPAVREAQYAGFDPMTDLALATFGWGWHLEAALAALRLIVRGTLDRHPDLQLVLGHWGELLLFWRDRTDSLSRVAGLERKVSDYVRTNVHVTASGMLSPALLHHALEVTTPDRLLFSTDYPFQRPTRVEIDAFVAELPGDHERELFTSGNARALFGLTGT